MWLGWLSPEWRRGGSRQRGPRTATGRLYPWWVMSGSVVDDLLPSGTFKEGRRGALGSSSLLISTKSGILPSPSASPVSWALPFTVPYYLSWTGLYMPLIMAACLILSVGTSSCPSELFSPALPEKTCFLKDPCTLEEGQFPDLHSNPSISWALEVLNSKVELKTLFYPAPKQSWSCEDHYCTFFGTAATGPKTWSQTQ